MVRDKKNVDRLIKCEHEFFLDSFNSNYESIKRECGDDWNVKCAHCGTPLAGSSAGNNLPAIVLWSRSESSWFGKFEIR